MSEADDYLRALLRQAAEEEAFLGGLRRGAAAHPKPAPAAPVPPPAVSLMITNRQRAELRARGVSDDAVRQMSPAQAHALLGLSEPEA